MVNHVDKAAVHQLKKTRENMVNHEWPWSQNKNVSSLHKKTRSTMVSNVLETALFMQIVQPSLLTIKQYWPWKNMVNHVHQLKKTRGKYGQPWMTMVTRHKCAIWTQKTWSNMVNHVYIISTRMCWLWPNKQGGPWSIIVRLPKKYLGDILIIQQYNKTFINNVYLKKDSVKHTYMYIELYNCPTINEISNVSIWKKHSQIT